jgi:hypothetical protein
MAALKVGADQLVARFDVLLENLGNVPLRLLFRQGLIAVRFCK